MAKGVLASPAPSGASNAEDDGERWDAGDGAVLSAAPSSRCLPFAPEPPLRKAPLRKEAEAGSVRLAGRGEFRLP